MTMMSDASDVLMERNYWLCCKHQLEMYWKNNNTGSTWTDKQNVEFRSKYWDSISSNKSKQKKAIRFLGPDFLVVVAFFGAKCAVHSQIQKVSVNQQEFMEMR